MHGNSSDSGTGWIIAVLVGALLVWQCSKDNDDQKPIPYVPTIVPNSSAEATPSPTTLPTQEPVAPSHNYVASEGTTYFYSMAVTEEQRKVGKRAPDILQARFLGKNADGEYIVEHLTSTGNPYFRSFCKKPCQIIRYDTGERVGFDERSMIGAVHADAINGFLKRYRAPEPKAVVPTDEAQMAADQRIEFQEQPATN